MDTPLFNILCRTSNRPKAFRNCFQSILSQTYNEIRLLVSADDNKSFDYASKILKHKIAGEIIRPKRVERNPNKTLQLDGYPLQLYHAPYNLYENDFFPLVKQGFIIYLDDDDIFTSPESLNIIKSKIKSEDDLLLWRVDINGRIVPDDLHFGKPPQLMHISGIGFAFHSKYKEYAYWDEFSCCDFRVISRLWNVIPNKIFINEVLTATQSIGQGNRKDM